MAFVFDSSKASTGFEPIPVGTELEMIIQEAEVKTASTGTTFINMRVVVRDDVDQPYKGYKIYHRLFFTEKTEGIIHGFLKAIGTPEGKAFDGIDDIKNYIIGKSFIGRVGQEESKGNIYNNISSVKESKYSTVDSGQPIDIYDDDLPF